MNSENLNAEQKAMLMARVRRDQLYYRRLLERMKQKRWPADDPVYMRTETAQNVLYSLFVYIDAIGNDHGRPRKSVEQLRREGEQDI